MSPVGTMTIPSRLLNWLGSGIELHRVIAIPLVAASSDTCSSKSVADVLSVANEPRFKSA